MIYLENSIWRIVKSHAAISVSPDRPPHTLVTSAGAAARLLAVFHWAIWPACLASTAWAGVESRAPTGAEEQDISALDQAAKDLTINDTSRYFVRLSPQPVFPHEPPEPLKAQFLETFARELWSQYDREHGPLRFVEDLAPAKP